MAAVARKIQVRGRVQGVGFRESKRKMAQQLGVVGWVLNRPDGSVEAFVQGELVAVEDMLQWCRLGPPHSSVEDLGSETAEPDPSLKSFERRELA